MTMKDTKDTYMPEELLRAFTYMVKVACGLKIIIIINTDLDDDTKLRRMEIKYGKKTLCGNFEGLGRILTLGIRRGVTANQIAESFKDIRCNQANNTYLLSCEHAIAIALKKQFNLNVEIISGEKGVVPEETINDDSQKGKKDKQQSNHL